MRAEDGVDTLEQGARHDPLVLEPDAEGPLELAPSAAASTPKRLGRMQVYVRRFFRNTGAVIGLVIFVLLIVLALLGEPVVKAALGWTYDSVDFRSLSIGPSATHWFGSTQLGGDVFAQVCHGLSLSIRIAVIVSLATVAISALVGASAAYFGGRVEKVMLWIIHFLLVIPSFLILALFSNSAGGKWWVLALALIGLGWMFSARVVWSLSMSIREREFVTAARYMGVSGFVTVVRHIIPNIGSLLIIQFALGIVSTVNAETGLSFLGFGIKIPEVSLGTLLADGSNNVTSMPWLFFFPAGALTLLTTSMALIADGLRDALDPNSAAGGKA